MSGIAGWIDHERDLRRERPTLLAMIAALAQRGPDGERLWLAENAAVGARWSDADGTGAPRQPWVLQEDGRTVLAAAVTGVLYDTDVLRGELGITGPATQAELAGRAWLRWGERFAEHLDGAFAVAVWSERDRELVLARDRLGNQPLYYYPLPSGVLFGSERKAVLAHPAVEPVIDADGLRELFSYAGTAGHGILKGFHQVPPGHVLRFTREGRKTYRYWELTAEEHTDDQAETIARIRELLGASVRRTLGTGAVPGILLSGGIDSSAVTALAHQALAERGGGETVRTFTVSFGAAEEFKQDEIWGSPDAPFVQSVVRHLGTEHTDLVLDTSDIIDPAVRSAVLRAKDVPSPLGNMNTSLYLLCRAVREHVGSVLLGEIADAVFGGFAWVHNKELVEAPTLPWVAMARFGGGRHGLGGDLLAPDLLGKLDLNGYCADAYTTSMAQVPRLAGESGQTLRMREITYFHLTRWLETLLSHDESLGSAVGLGTRMPFCDWRLVNYAYNVPWSLKSFDGREKSLLRAAVADLLPDDVVNRAKSPYPVTQDPAYGRALCERMATLLADPTAPAAPLADTSGIQSLIDDPSVLDSGMRAWVARANVEMLLGLNDWLRGYGVRVEL
ncbi:asparagine synthase (glutamine-hydrolyzing) [Streptomyces dysideae]|uniref:asparagine synthase (glutamine-hydrolyzing) n=1 Tax=Streptomyces dysideae TaxID=909626 RepID=UPI00082F49DC|nr:asparagine synthase (glutamine-hydrolyzing) [Streptomyces dysideae]